MVNDCFYIYILYSLSSKAFYIGYSNDPIRRLEEHNTRPFNTYTSKFRPWTLAAVFKCGPSKKEAAKLERFIKAQKSRKLIEQLIDPSFIPQGSLAQLARVPHPV
jgi:putative endonuclease